MVYLHWDYRDFGQRFERHGTVKAAYNTLDEAKAQAEHDLARGRRPLFIADEDGNHLWDAPQT